MKSDNRERGSAPCILMVVITGIVLILLKDCENYLSNAAHLVQIRKLIPPERSTLPQFSTRSRLTYQSFGADQIISKVNFNNLGYDFNFEKITEDCHDLEREALLQSQSPAIIASSSCIDPRISSRFHTYGNMVLTQEASWEQKQTEIFIAGMLRVEAPLSIDGECVIYAGGDISISNLTILPNTSVTIFSLGKVTIKALLNSGRLEIISPNQQLSTGFWHPPRGSPPPLKPDRISKIMWGVQ